MKSPKIIISCAVGIIIVLYVLNMIYFSMKPDAFPVQGVADAPTGTLFVDTVAQLMTHELSGPGGWQPNDIPPSPTWLLDNRPNFQRGVLEVVRYSARVLRDNLSRQRTTDKIDPNCDEAFTRFSNDPEKWIIPSAEGKYKGGIDALNTFNDSLMQGGAHFYPRSDNLIQLLEQYASLLGGVTTRLLNAARPDEAFEQAAGDAGAGRPVPWSRIDDNFYYAQGVGYGMLHTLQAIAVDFDKVLKDKNADIILGEIIDSLRESYFEPIIVTNGSRAGVLANHSNNLRVFLDDARQKSNSLIKMLDQG